MASPYSDSLYRVAQHLFEQANKDKNVSEAMLRSAIGRAYYSAFWIARDFVEKVGTDVGVHQTHKTVCDYFCRSKDTELLAIGQELYRLKHARAQADYTDGFSPNREEVAMQIVRARSIRDRLDGKRAACD